MKYKNTLSTILLSVIALGVAMPASSVETNATQTNKTTVKIQAPAIHNKAFKFKSQIGYEPEQENTLLQFSNKDDLTILIKEDGTYKVDMNAKYKATTHKNVTSVDMFFGKVRALVLELTFTSETEGLYKQFSSDKTQESDSGSFKVVPTVKNLTK